MSNQRKALLENLCFGCIAGIYSGIVLFAVVVSLFFQTSFDGISALYGYAIAMAIGGVIGLVFAYILYNIKGKYNDSNK